MGRSAIETARGIDAVQRSLVCLARLPRGMPVELRSGRILRQPTHTAETLEETRSLRNGEKGEGIARHGGRQKRRSGYGIRRQGRQQIVSEPSLSKVCQRTKALHHGHYKRYLFGCSQGWGSGSVHQSQLRSQLPGRTVEGTRDYESGGGRPKGHSGGDGTFLRLSMGTQTGPSPDEMPLRFKELSTNTGSQPQHGGRRNRTALVAALEKTHDIQSRKRNRQPVHQIDVERGTRILSRGCGAVRRENREAFAHVPARSRRSMGGLENRRLDDSRRRSRAVHYSEEEHQQSLEQNKQRSIAYRRKFDLWGALAGPTTTRNDHELRIRTYLRERSLVRSAFDRAVSTVLSGYNHTATIIEGRNPEQHGPSRIRRAYASIEGQSRWDHMENDYSGFRRPQGEADPGQECCVHRKQGRGGQSREGEWWWIDQCSRYSRQNVARRPQFNRVCFPPDHCRWYQTTTA
mmetsp:Transcript_20556/g.57040  ORF Transcript_20556/g.57040 Transcript_20556/m.57040 type:complete len:461 (+) Transcript_20556:644-2026(+)